MKYKWLKNQTNAAKSGNISDTTARKDTGSKLIAFFNGWGMDESIVSHLDPEDYDVLMFYDYNTLETDFDFSFLDRYLYKYLVAWSMGVMTATLFDINYDKKTAINGTLKPIDDKFGIPRKMYDLTLKGLTPKGVERFIKNMFTKEELMYYNPTLPYLSPKHPQEVWVRQSPASKGGKGIQREFENQKSELEALTHYEANPDFKYDRIIISTDDKIIPTKNQAAFWGIEPNIKSGHAPFLHFTKWSELL